MELKYTTQQISTFPTPSPGQNRNERRQYDVRSQVWGGCLWGPMRGWVGTVGMKPFPLTRLEFVTRVCTISRREDHAPSHYFEHLSTSAFADASSPLCHSYGKQARPGTSTKHTDHGGPCHRATRAISAEQFLRSCTYIEDGLFLSSYDPHSLTTGMPH